MEGKEETLPIIPQLLQKVTPPLFPCKTTTLQRTGEREKEMEWEQETEKDRAAFREMERQRDEGRGKERWMAGTPQCRVRHGSW